MKNNIQNEINKSFLPFTEEELKQLNLTEEELNILEDASAISETLDMLPDDPDKFLDRVDKEFPYNDPNQVFQKLADLAKKDPAFVNELIAVVDLTGRAREVEEPQVEKVSINEINQLNEQARDEEIKKLANDLIDSFVALTPEERKQVINKFTNKK